jgi:hypothetical protein
MMASCRGAARVVSGVAGCRPDADATRATRCGGFPALRRVPGAPESPLPRTGRVVFEGAMDCPCVYGPVVGGESCHAVGKVVNWEVGGQG